MTMSYPCGRMRVISRGYLPKQPQLKGWLHPSPTAELRLRPNTLHVEALQHPTDTKLVICHRKKSQKVVPEMMKLYILILFTD